MEPETSACIPEPFRAAFGALARVLDPLQVGLALCTRDGAVRAASPALRALSRAAERRVREGVGALARAVAEGGEPLVVPLRAGEELLAASGAAFGGDLGGGLVVVAVDRRLPPPPPAAAIRARLRLSAAEAQVARLVALGCTNREVGARLGISFHTARHHVEQVLYKLRVPSRTAVAGALFERTAPRVPLPDHRAG